MSALAAPYEGFSFRLRGAGHIMPNGAGRVEVSLDYLGKPWGTIQVDLGPQEGGGTEVDMVEAISLAPFGLEGPGSLPCLSLPYHVAQKIHAMTAPPLEGRRNDRFRDLVDLLLMREWITDFQAVLRACMDVFETRSTHAWPPAFRAPEHWVAPFAAMARELDLETTDVYQAAHEGRAFINTIDETSELLRPIRLDDSVTAATWFFVVGEGDVLRRIPAERGEAFFIEPDPPALEDVPAEWQREPGGVALLGVVVLLQNRRPLFVLRAATRGRAISREMHGKPVEFTPAVWNALALGILRHAKAPERAVDGLSSFLSHTQGPLPADIAGRARITTREMHKYFVPPLLPEGVPLWDLWDSELVLYAARKRTLAFAPRKATPELLAIADDYTRRTPHRARAARK